MTQTYDDAGVMAGKVKNGMDKWVQEILAICNVSYPLQPLNKFNTSTILFQWKEI